MSKKTHIGTKIFLAVALSLLPGLAGFYTVDALLGDTVVVCKSSQKCEQQTTGYFTGDLRLVKSVAAQ